MNAASTPYGLVLMRRMWRMPVSAAARRGRRWERGADRDRPRQGGAARGGEPGAGAGRARTGPGRGRGRV